MAKRMIFPACAFLAMAAACAAPESAADAETKKTEPFSTVKPGAAVSFSHSLRAPVDPGGDGVLLLTIRETYDNGAMLLEASSEGLELAGASRSKTLSMDAGDTHQWDLYFDASDGGVYYIDIVAIVDDGNGGGSTRSYSAAIQVGDDATVAKPSADVIRDAAGVPVVVMEAEETVED